MIKLTTLLAIWVCLFFAFIIFKIKAILVFLPIFAIAIFAYFVWATYETTKKQPETDKESK